MKYQVRVNGITLVQMPRHLAESLQFRANQYEMWAQGRILGRGYGWRRWFLEGQDVQTIELTFPPDDPLKIAYPLIGAFVDLARWQARSGREPRRGSQRRSR